MSPITYEDAFNATNPDPKAYGLPDGASDEDVKKKRDDAATNIIAGVAANDAYWDSRNRLEALEARAQGHGLVSRGPNEGEEAPTVVGGGTVSGTVEAGTTGAPGTAPALEPADQGGDDAAAKLRAQVESLGGTPEA